MTRRFLGLASLLFGLTLTGVASADPIEIEVRIVKQDGSAYAGLPVRLVVGSEPDSRAPNAGETLTTDADGRIARHVDAPVVKRQVSVDMTAAKQESDYLAVAVELDLIGRRALYWTNLDALKSGVLGQMVAYLPSGNGAFDAMLVFHDQQHAWSFPDAPDGMMLTSIGAELKHHDLRRSDDGKGWVVTLEIEKMEFTVR